MTDKHQKDPSQYITGIALIVLGIVFTTTMPRSLKLVGLVFLLIGSIYLFKGMKIKKNQDD